MPGEFISPGIFLFVSSRSLGPTIVRIQSRSAVVAKTPLLLREGSFVLTPPAEAAATRPSEGGEFEVTKFAF
jgi:hypothetical protein